MGKETMKYPTPAEISKAIEEGVYRAFRDTMEDAHRNLHENITSAITDGVDRAFVINLPDRIKEAVIEAMPFGEHIVQAVASGCEAAMRKR